MLDMRLIGRQLSFRGILFLYRTGQPRIQAIPVGPFNCPEAIKFTCQKPKDVVAAESANNSRLFILGES